MVDDFEDLTPGEYIIKFITPDGFTLTEANVGGDDTIDSDAGPGGLTGCFVLDSGEYDPTWDAGLVQAAGLGDFVFEDTNANGIQDAGEMGINGATVTLLADTDGDGEIDDVVATTTTGDDPDTPETEQGYYEFTGLAPGVEYQVQFTTPDGFDAVSPRQEGGDSAIDSDGLLSDVVVLESGEFDPTLDSGLYHDTTDSERD